MIESLDIRNFQSLHHVQIDLAPFTVIVGASSSGKSALTRALRTLIANRRGADWITHGERSSSITARTSHGTVTLNRARSTASGNEYIVRPNDPAHPLAPQQTYTKLGGDTPPEVTEFIGIDPKDPITFAGQFDRPYLLDDSAGEVARTLGSLTNVNVIFEASRESTRRRLDASRVLKTKADDLAQIKARIPEYRGIKAQVASLEQANEHIDIARSAQQSITSLTAALEARAVARTHLESIAPRIAMVIPSEEPIIEAGTALTAYRDALIAQNRAREAVSATALALEQATADSDSLDAEYASALEHLAQGFEAHMRNEPLSIVDSLDNVNVKHAAESAAGYVSSFIR